MKLIYNLFFLFVTILFLIYLITPNTIYPTPLSQSLVSNEPADLEENERRGYFTNFSRQEVMDHYMRAFTLKIFRVPLKPIRLNYPPEEAYERIRDQTRSTFLEELVFPFRESIYVNGFEPKEDKDAIIVGGQRYRQKIIVRNVKSSVYIRTVVGLLTMVYAYFLIIKLSKLLKELFSKE